MPKADARADMFVTLTRDLKRKLIAEAAARDLPLNEVTVSILADAYKVAYVPSGSRFGGATDTPDVLLRLPLALKKKIQARAVARQRPDRQETMDALDAYFVGRAAA